MDRYDGRYSNYGVSLGRKSKSGKFNIKQSLGNFSKQHTDDSFPFFPQKIEFDTFLRK